MIGETLGQYRIEARLGEGGMGVVYRARDERLQRTVAIKLVGTGTAGSSTPEDRSRLLDEARAASHLNHPHICTVYEVGDAGGRVFIAMEYVDGRPLSEMLPLNGLPVESVLRYGAQIAGALAHAHERGVIHRDLKTANVVVSPEHGAKVLDFGLARRLEPDASEAVTKSIDGAHGATAIAGTLAYIAPETLLGHGVDARSDIWSLGVVLFEIATGELPFPGRNEFETSAAILRAPPQPFPAHVPPLLRGIIQRCLAKDPSQRYQRAGEARAALEAVQSDSLVMPAALAARRSWWPWLAAGGAAIAAGVVWMTWKGADRPREDLGPGGGQLTRIVSSEYQTIDPALSADRRMLTYAASGADGRIDLFSARVAGGGRVQLTNDTAREEAPKFSPDGERIAFMRRDADNPSEIRIVPALGGDVAATIPNAAYPAWSPDGRRLVYLRRKEAGIVELVTSRPDGSDVRALLQSDSVYPFLRNPAWSPDGRQIAFVKGSGGIAGEIWIVPSEGGPARPAIKETGPVASDSPVFTADGRGIVHASNRGGATNLWYLPLTGGTPIRLTTGPGPDESPSVATDGAVAFVNSRWRNTLEVHDLPAGTSRVLVSHSPFLWAPAVSPGGREIAFSRSEADGSWHIWTVPADGGNPKRLTAGEAGEVYPRYSADGTSILFHTWAAPRRVGQVSPAGGAMTFLPLKEGDSFAELSPDGKTLAFTRADTPNERVYLAAPGGADAQLLTTSPGAVPRWSPDGTHVAFAANRGYTGGIFVIKRDGTGERRLTPDGGWPVWWPGGKQIAFLTQGPQGNQIRVVSLDGATRLIGSIKLEGSNHPFAVFPDGWRIAGTNAVHVSDEIWLLEPRR
jgi:Tol biopolymer transport system component/predicted Ser/Thr protein kinase